LLLKRQESKMDNEVKHLFSISIKKNTGFKTGAFVFIIGYTI